MDLTNGIKISGIYALTALVIALALTVALYFINGGELPSSGEISLVVVVALIVTFGVGAILRRRRTAKDTASSSRDNTPLGVILLCSALGLAAGCAHEEPPPPPPPPPPATANGGAAVAIGRAFLYRGEPEDSAFGFFSYLLLPSAPATPTQRDRYRAAIEAFLRTARAEELAEQIPKRDLNVLYVPLTQRTREHPDSVLKYYDYARATVILARIPDVQNQGPYLVSTEVPVTTTAPAHYLLQDLALVFPTVIDAWVREFKKAALNPRFWDPAQRNQFVLNLRNVIAVAAAVVPNVQDAVKSWIKWIGA